MQSPCQPGWDRIQIMMTTFDFLEKLSRGAIKTQEGWDLEIQAVENVMQDLSGKSLDYFIESVQDDLIERHSWWSRLWVVQEVVLNQNVVVHRGNCHILWLDMMCGVAWLRSQTEGLIRSYPFRDVLMLPPYRSPWGHCSGGGFCLWCQNS
jgi:hypothetical protein